MADTLFEIFKRAEAGDDDPNVKEEITIKGQRFVVSRRNIINLNPSPGEVYAELELVKPRGYISYAADEIFELKAIQRTGIPWLDEGLHPQPVYRYKLRPDRQLNQCNVERKIQEKSPCCKRTLRYVTRGGLVQKFCRKCDRQV
jgi:hypothetical protein